MKWIFCVIFLLFLIPSVAAQEMTSPSYKLELEQIEATTSARLQTLSTKQLKQFHEDGYLINTQKKGTLLFNISDTVLNFKDNENVQTNSILTSVNGIPAFAGMTPDNDTSSSVIPAEAGIYDEEFGYQIIAQLTKQFESNSGEGIDWGYHISGPDSPFNFKDDNDYKQLKTEAFSLVAGNEWTTSERSTKMLIKLNRSAKQFEENYNAVIKLIALPSL